MLLNSTVNTDIQPIEWIGGDYNILDLTSDSDLKGILEFKVPYKTTIENIEYTYYTYYRVTVQQKSQTNTSTILNFELEQKSYAYGTDLTFNVIPGVEGTWRTEPYKLELSSKDNSSLNYLTYTKIGNFDYEFKNYSSSKNVFQYNINFTRKDYRSKDPMSFNTNNIVSSQSNIETEIPEGSGNYYDSKNVKVILNAIPTVKVTTINTNNNIYSWKDTANFTILNGENCNYTLLMNTRTNYLTSNVITNGVLQSENETISINFKEFAQSIFNLWKDGDNIMRLYIDSDTTHSGAYYEFYINGLYFPEVQSYRTEGIDSKIAGSTKYAYLKSFTKDGDTNWKFFFNDNDVGNLFNGQIIEFGSDDENTIKCCYPVEITQTIDDEEITKILYSYKNFNITVQSYNNVLFSAYNDNDEYGIGLGATARPNSLILNSIFYGKELPTEYTAVGQLFFKIKE